MGIETDANSCIHETYKKLKGQAMFGVIDTKGNYTDVSTTLLGAKQYATRNGYTRVGQRSEFNNMVVRVYVRKGGKWHEASD